MLCPNRPVLNLLIIHWLDTLQLTLGLVLVGILWPWKGQKLSHFFHKLHVYRWLILGGGFWFYGHHRINGHPNFLEPPSLVLVKKTYQTFWPFHGHRKLVTTQTTQKKWLSVLLDDSKKISESVVCQLLPPEHSLRGVKNLNRLVY